MPEYLSFQHDGEDRDFPWKVLSVTYPDGKGAKEKQAAQGALPVFKTLYKSSVWGSAYGWWQQECEKRARALKGGST